MISKNEAKYIQSLYHKKTRYEEKLFVVEGVKMVEELLASAFITRKIYATAKWKHNHKIDCIEITEDELAKISNLQTPNEVLAIVEMPERNIHQNICDNFCIALDNIQDPGNLGTIIRLADWFGIKHIIASEETVDCYNPKVVQSTMGSIMRVEVFYTNLESFFSNNKPDVFGALLNGKSMYDFSPVQKGVLLIGNESKGISTELISFIKHPISIPRKGNAESLNAAVATGIILSQLLR